MPRSPAPGKPSCAESSSYRFRLFGSHLQESTCRPLRSPAPLLPVAQRGDTDADHESELRLRLFKPDPYGLDVSGPEPKHSAWASLAATNLSRLLYAGDQLLEIARDHLNSFRRRRRRTRNCSRVRSSCSFFGYANSI